MDPRDELWSATFETYYDAFYEELLAERLVRHWQRADDITKVLVALTTSGSAVSGWALWTAGEWKILWTLLAGFAAVLSIVHTALRVSDRLKRHIDCERRFCSLRSDLETFRYEMRLKPDFGVDEFTRRFVDYRKEFAAHSTLIEHDLLATRRLEKAVQDDLNDKLVEEIQSA